MKNDHEDEPTTTEDEPVAPPAEMKPLWMYARYVRHM